MWLFSRKEKVKKEKKEKTSMDFKVISGINIDRGDLVSLNKLEEGISIDYGSQQYYIAYQDMLNIACKTYTEEEIKNKSVIGRALVGGILTGGVGAVVGGMSGVGSKKKINKISAVEINYTKNGIDKTVLLEDCFSFGKWEYVDSIQEKVEEALKNKKEINIGANDISEQIRKLADLKNQGIITEDEFIQGKTKLLNS